MSTTKTLLGFLAGASVGALAGVLLAPDKGTETRKKLLEKSKDLGNSLKDSASGIMNKVSDAVPGGKRDGKDSAEQTDTSAGFPQQGEKKQWS